MHKITAKTPQPLIAEFESFIRDPGFPCVGAKAALLKSQMDVVLAHDIRSAWDDLEIHARIGELVDLYRKILPPFAH
jgi:hypothetical protein